MEYLNELGAQYEGLFSMASGVFGLAGFVFGAWRYTRERHATLELEKSKLELDHALSRLKHLENFASDLKQYPRAV